MENHNNFKPFWTIVSIVFLIVLLCGLFFGYSHDDQASAATSTPPEPFLYLPFDKDVNGTQLSWKYPTSYFDHHFPKYQQKTKATTSTEVACLQNFLDPFNYSEENLAIGPGLEFPRTQNGVEKVDYYNGKAWIKGYACSFCEESYVYYDGHPGYDWGIPEKTKVYAAGTGIIRYANCDKNFSGCNIKIEHVLSNGETYTTHYFHLFNPDTPGISDIPWPGRNGVPSVGQQVQPSQVIAWSGRTGWDPKTLQYTPWSPHLHFEVRHNGNPVDPWGWTPYIRDAGNPDADPLQCYQGEKSYNLFVGYEPHCYTCILSKSDLDVSELKQTSFSSFPPTDYLGGSEDESTGVVDNDSGIFVSDLTLPDGTIVSPAQSLTKTWRMKNTGTSSWGSGYKLAFLRGDRLNAPAEIDVPSTSPGQTVDLNLPITAPAFSGSFQGYWRLRNPQGTFFGPEIWISINVQISSSYITLLETDPVSPATTNMVRIHARVENFPNLRAIRVKVDGEIKGEIGGPEIWVEWSTSDYQTGTHSIVVEAANQSDLNWVNPEIRGTTFILEGNTISTNHAPNPPSLSNPGDWAVYEGTSGINLSAHENGDPDGDTVTHYYFEIFESHDIPNSGWISSNTWSPTGLSYYGYQWHVKVRDNGGAESGWSETRHFTVNDPEPQIYSFYSQVCRPAWNQGDPDKICFCAETNAGTLQLQLNSANDGTGNGEWKVINELGSSNYSCSLDTDSPPTIDPKELTTGTHLVRLYARKDGGWVAAKTQDITISVGNLRPNLPLAQTLTNGAYTNSQNVTFIWNSTQRTSNYRVEVSSVADFSSHLLDQTLPSTQTQLNFYLDSPYDPVHWKVTSIGPYGSNSASNLFHVDVTSPITSLSVASNTVYENNFPVNWSGSDSQSGLQTFHLQVLDTTHPDSMWADWLVNTAQTASIFQGQVGHTYKIRIRGMDLVGNWEDWPSENGSRQVWVMIDPSTRPLEPWWNNGYSYKRSITVLNNDSDWVPSHYPIHIQFNSSTTPTAAEIYNASLSATKANDFRVIYNNATDLNRYVQRFTVDQIDVWFPLQVGLGSGISDTSSYQIYYGNSNPGIPHSDLNSIFMPIADTNTVGLWHFQDGSGSYVVDSSGRGHLGTFYNPGWTDGLLGRAGLFNGINSYVDAGNSNDFNLATGPMTLEAWFYLTNRGDYPHLISKWGQDGSYFLRLISGEKGHFSTRGGGEISVGEKVQLNTWYHIAATYDGSSTMRIYINGNLLAVKTGVTDGILTSHNLLIGSSGGYDGGNFPGFIQHVRVSNIERTDFSYARIEIQPTVIVGIQQILPIQGHPDLSITNINANLTQTGGILVNATVENQGDKDTLNGFYTDLYIDHLPTGAGDYTGSLQFWVNDPIPAGETVTLTTVIADPINIGLMSTLPGEERYWTLFAQTDSTGTITETDNVNNITASGTDICVAAGDVYETGDEIVSGASTLTEPQLHNFDRPGDEDWVKFTAVKDQLYTLTTSALGSNADTYLYLYDQDGTTLLASNDDYNGSLASRIKWIAPADGVYYILIKQWNPNSGGCGTSYTFSFGGNLIYLPIISR